MTFEEQMAQAVRNSVIKQISQARFVDPYGQKQGKVPENIVDMAWASVDWDDVTKQIKQQIQDSICSVVVQSMLTEIKNDTKSILSIQGVRQKIKAEAYPKIMSALTDA